MRPHERLDVWKRSVEFVVQIYKMTETFPREERFGLTSQVRRAAVSIAANIVEGFKKKGQQDKARFLNIAQGSLEECRYYLILVSDLNYGDTTELTTQLEEVSRLLTSYHNAVASKF